ncbi:MAG: M20/M25/M40 family metallo-hydrolase [Kofleriaceae bacterium]
MNRSIKFLLAVSLAGCAAADPGDPIDTPEEEGMRWITIGADAINTAQMALDERLPGRVLTPVRMAGNVAVLSYDAADFHALSELMHARHNRCGGFMVHDSLKDAEDALRSAEAEAIAPLAVSYTLDNPATVNGMLPELQATRIVQMINDLSAFQNRYYTSSFGTQSSDFIFNTWSSIAASRTDITVERFTHTWAQKSVILTIPGTSLPNEVVIIGGHQDSIASGGATSIAPGADDDASGIATITEVLRAMVAKNFRPARTIKLMAYAAEEVGLRGSAAIATSYQSQGINVVGVVQFDMTNYKGSTKDIWLMQDYTNAAQNTFVTNLINTYVGATVGVDSCGYGCSDHASWHNRGYPTSMPFESAMSQYNPNIHTSRDRISVSGSNADHAMKFARLGVAYAAELAKGSLGTTPGNNPPTVSVTAPTAGSTVSGTITVSATAADSDGTVASVRFDLPDGSTVTDTTAPYSATFNTTLVANGAHVFRATAMDNTGASSAPSSVTATVQNGGGTCIDGIFNATGLPIAIPDNNVTGIVSTLPVVGNGTVATLALSLNINHTWRGDLVVTLVAPSGAQYIVSNRSGGSADNIILTNSVITALNGQTAAGTWQLKVQDRASADIGNLNSWSLKITGTCP